MRTTRLYLNSPLTSGQSIVLGAEDAHRVGNVIRIRIGQSLIVFNGLGGEFSAKVTEIYKKKIILFIEHYHPVEAESPLNIHLIQGISRGQKMDLTLQKATELGVKKIYPLAAHRSSVKLIEERAANRLEHWQSILVHAAEQSGRNRLPELVPPQSLLPIIESLPPSLRLILSPQNGENLNSLSSAPSSDFPIVLLIGPEGGFSEEENILAQQHGFFPLTLGPRILRTETAGLAMISILQYLWGDLGP